MSDSLRKSPLSVLIAAGPIALFLVATTFGVLEVHSSTDTWIGLAAGKQIVEMGRVPTEDTFSIGFQGQPWFNQNWLSHLYFYWLYAEFGPNWVIYGTWLASAGIFLFSMLACRLRSGLWLPSIIAASIVAIGCRDWISARPATIQFLCLSAFWMLLCALEGQREKTRWWPIAALLPLFLVWGNAHGSFVFGYAVAFAYLAHWALMYYVAPRFFVSARGWIVLKPAQAVALLIVLVGSALAILIFGPFGSSNFLHPEKVASSDLWRQVGEWHPPWPPLSKTPFPPVLRLWAIFFGIAAIFAFALGVKLVTAPQRDATTARRGAATRRDAAPLIYWSLFDIAATLLGLAMTLWARRFGPIFLIFAAPPMLIWTLQLMRDLAPATRRLLRDSIYVGCWLGAIGVGLQTYYLGSKELLADLAGRPYPPEMPLIERVTRYESVPHDAIEFIRENDLTVNLFVEWTVGGPVMFYAPTAKVFMDGRAQQVYDERQYYMYQFMITDRVPPQDPRRQRILDGIALDGTRTGHPRVDGVMLRVNRRSDVIARSLDVSGQWVLAYFSWAESVLYLRRDSEPLAALQRRLLDGTAHYPDTPESCLSRGNLYLSMNPPDIENGLRLHLEAIERSPILGTVNYGTLASIYAARDGVPAAMAFVENERQRMAGLSLNESDRRSVALALDAVRDQLGRQQSPSSAPQRRPPRRSDGSTP